VLKRDPAFQNTLNKKLELRNRKRRERESRGSCLIDEFPLDGHHAFFLRSNRSKCANGEIDRVAVLASWAIVSNFDGDGLAVVGVFDQDEFSAQRRSFA
jgi:hypothetical protein